MVRSPEHALKVFCSHPHEDGSRAHAPEEQPNNTDESAGFCDNDGTGDGSSAKKHPTET